MIQSLDDARDWYKAVKTLVDMIDRIARLYWSEEHGEKTLNETLYRDRDLKEYQAAKIRELATAVRADLDDLAVLLLFSVFEANVRDRTLDEMNRELAAPFRHPALRKAVDEARQAVEQGSFGRLTETYKSLDPDLKTQVDQVRKYRNWVAHGRRGGVENNIVPDSALARLEGFLKVLDTSLVDPAPEPPDV